MIPIHVRFLRFSEVTVRDLLDYVGVYVLWTDTAAAKPSYIGEGADLLSRIGVHYRNLPGFDGVVALVEDKDEARIVEAALLHCADEVGLKPAKNIKMGAKTLKDAVEAEGKIRVTVAGQDPLRAPESPAMAQPKVIEIDVDYGEPFVARCPWNRR
jgi:hypothetical protein